MKKYLITENQFKYLVENIISNENAKKWFLKIIDKLEKKEYSDWTYWVYGDEIYMRHHNNRLWVNYQEIWKLLKDKYFISDKEIIKLIKDVMGKDLKPYYY